MFRKKRKNKNGFSFVEVMVTVFLVSVGLLATVSLLTSGLRESMDSRNQLIGSFLAQEGAELVRGIRDKNWADSKPSFTGIQEGNNQKISYNDVSLKSGGSDKLKINSDGFYNYAQETDTKFYRRIDIFGNDTSSRTVTSVVLWDGKGAFDTVYTGGSLDEAKCHTANKCAYATDVLTSWAE